MPRPKKKSSWVSVYSFERGYSTLEEPIEKALHKAHIGFKVVLDKISAMWQVVVKSVDYDRAFKVVRKTIDEELKFMR